MDPKIVGPGIWFVIHNKAVHAVTAEKKVKFIDFITELAETFPCTICKEHMTKYIKNHPISSFTNIIDNGRDIGMFKWTWIFHNSVNTRLRKSYMDWNSACNMYLK